MDSLHIGSDELVYIQTEKLSVTIKGNTSHPNAKAALLDDTSTLKVFCDDAFDIMLRGQNGLNEHNAILSAKRPSSKVYSVKPLFFEQQRYELIIEAAKGEKVSFWHDNVNIRNKIAPVGRNTELLSGVINFGNDIGFSDLIVRLGDINYLRIVIEVFPSKISYKEDYISLIEDVTKEVYNVVFDFLKKTYLGYRQSDKAKSSPVEFFSIINTIYTDFLKATDMILARPHHILEKTYEELPKHKTKRVDLKAIRWIEKHPEYVQQSKNGFTFARALAVKRQVTFQTKENCLTKYILQTTIKRLEIFKRNFLRMQSNDEEAVAQKIDNMIKGLTRRITFSFLADVDIQDVTFNVSLVFSMAPGYRDLYKYHLMLLHGLSLNGDVFNISVKELSLLYEYWCFIKLNSLMRDRYELVSQDFIKVQHRGLFISLAKGQGSNVRYKNPETNEIITLSYNPKTINSPTGSQRPDNVLALEKKGAEVQYQYIFDAKYRINLAFPDTDYYKSISTTPGPEIDDINAMHRYRDAIVYQTRTKPFEQTMFGAYVLFPYNDEVEYKQHKFYDSIRKVNIGGLPFLPSTTSLVTEMLDELISDSPTSAFERAVLPRGIEAKLAKIDWSIRDVLIGTLRNKEQLDVCLNHSFYHIPMSQIKEDSLPIRYIAIYQSKSLFGSNAGIRYYGEVIKCLQIPRNEISEITRVSTELYYRFEIKEWQKLQVPIQPKEIGLVYKFTNTFLLAHSSEMPELLLQTEEEYRLYYELKRATNSSIINDENSSLGFVHNNVIFKFEEGQICLYKDKKVISIYEIKDFKRAPNAIFRRMQKELL